MCATHHYRGGSARLMVRADQRPTWAAAQCLTPVFASLLPLASIEMAVAE